MVMKEMKISICIIAAFSYACAASESIQYIATGRVCRPKNNDGYSRESGVDTPQSCQQKCDDDSARCGAWEFEDHDMDNKECGLHERNVISYQDTKNMGECQLPTDLVGDYRCCWIVKDLIDLQSAADIESNSNESTTSTIIAPTKEEEESKVNMSLGEIEPQSTNESGPDQAKEASEASKGITF